MLLTNQRLDKLAAARADFSQQGMLEGSILELATTQQVENASVSDEGEFDNGLL